MAPYTMNTGVYIGEGSELAGFHDRNQQIRALHEILNASSVIQWWHVTRQNHATFSYVSMI